MRALRAFGKYFWRFMIIFSFIVNIVLVVVLLFLGLTIFDIKKNIAQPLIEGLHSSFVGLNDATIDWTIPVRTSIPLNTSIPLETSIPLQTNTIVTLTEPVPLSVAASITLNGQALPVTVALTLPQGTSLPVALDLSVPVNLDVPVDLDVPVSLDVRAVIPLSQTQLHDPVDNLRLLFEPIVRALGNLPDDFGGVGPFIGQVLSGSPPNLLAETPYSQNPWPGYSTTAGLNYAESANMLVPPANQPLLTSIVPIGGIPALDQGLRPELYQDGSSPAQHNASVMADLQAQGFLPEFFDGSYAQTVTSPSKQAAGEAPPTTDGNQSTTDQPLLPGDGSAPTPIPDDLGIVATPVPGG